MIYKLLTKMVVGIKYYLNDYKGKVIILVNTATKCGLSGQFSKQKPGTDDQIAEIWKENQMEFHKIYYC